MDVILPDKNCTLLDGQTMVKDQEPKSFTANMDTCEAEYQPFECHINKKPIDIYMSTSVDYRSESVDFSLEFDNGEEAVVKTRSLSRNAKASAFRRCVSEGASTGTLSLTGDSDVTVTVTVGEDASCQLLLDKQVTGDEYQVDVDRCTSKDTLELLRYRVSRLESIILNVTDGNFNFGGGIPSEELQSQIFDIANDTEALKAIFTQISNQTAFLVEAANETLN